MEIVFLVLLGLCFGSFVNALVWRIHVQSKGGKSKKNAEYSISKGRSMCVHCKHVLAAKDLIPIFSWIYLRGKCCYCGKQISWQYPMVEAVTALLFVISYLFWPYEIAGIGVVSFAAWLMILVGLVALLIYDIKWMLLPNRIIFFLYWLAGVYVVARVVESSSLSSVSDYAMGVVIGGGIFYLLFQISSGRWIGGGDVKLGFLLGALVGSGYFALLLLFIASVLGSLYSLPLLAAKKANKSSRIPFGPFLIISAIVVVLFGNSLTDMYVDYILGGGI